MSEDHEYNRLWKEQNFWVSIWEKIMGITGYEKNRISEFYMYMGEEHVGYNRLWK